MAKNIKKRYQPVKRMIKACIWLGTNKTEMIQIFGMSIKFDVNNKNELTMKTRKHDLAVPLGYYLCKEDWRNGNFFVMSVNDFELKYERVRDEC